MDGGDRWPVRWRAGNAQHTTIGEGVRAFFFRRRRRIRGRRYTTRWTPVCLASSVRLAACGRVVARESRRKMTETRRREYTMKTFFQERRGESVRQQLKEVAISWYGEDGLCWQWCFQDRDKRSIMATFAVQLGVLESSHVPGLAG
jgi:hypothetical protein